MLKRCLLLFALLVPMLAPASDYRVGDRLPAGKGAAKGFKEIMWDDLMPKGWDPMAAFKGIDLNKLQDNDPKAIDLLASVRKEWDKAPVEPALNGQRIRIPGFVVPLERKGDDVIEFLLVPYFGACIHVPPPPSNQIVHATSELGVRVDALYEPFWIEGPLSVEHASSELAEAGYRMQAQKIYPYELQ